METWPPDVPKTHIILPSNARRSAIAPLPFRPTVLFSPDWKLTTEGILLGCRRSCLVFEDNVRFIMVNPGAFRGSRKSFLISQKPAYAEAVIGGFVGDALADIQRKYFKRYPIDLPHSEEPSEEFLLAVNDDGPDPEPEEPDPEKMAPKEYESTVKALQERTELIRFRKAQIKRWMAYQYMKDQDVDVSDSSSSNPYSAIFSHLQGKDSGRPRKKTAVNVWRKTQRHEIEMKVKSLAAANGTAKEHLAALRDKVARDMFNALPSSAQEKWKKQAEEESEAALLKWKEEQKEDACPNAAERQRCIQGITRLVQPFLDGLAKKTGWTATLITGGPEPADGGKLNIVSVHSGLTAGEVKMNFGRAERADYKKHIVPIYGRFLKKCYSPEECRSRALGVEEGFTPLSETEVESSGATLDVIGDPDAMDVDPSTHDLDMDSSASDIATSQSPSLAMGLRNPAGEADNSTNSALSNPSCPPQEVTPSTDLTTPSGEESDESFPTLAPTGDPVQPVTLEPGPIGDSTHLTEGEDSAALSGGSTTPSPRLAAASPSTPSQEAKPPDLQPPPAAVSSSPGDNSAIGRTEPFRIIHGRGVTPPRSPPLSPQPSPMRRPIMQLAVSQSSTVPEAALVRLVPPDPGLISSPSPPSSDSLSDRESPPSSPASSPPPSGPDLGVTTRASSKRNLPEPSASSARKRSRTNLDTASVSSTTPSSGTAKIVNPAGAPKWFADALAMLQAKNLGLQWYGALQIWVDLETRARFKERGKLGTQHRPSCVGDWIQRRRSTTWRPILDVADTEKKFTKWWASLQPDWRLSDDGVINASAEDGDWDDLWRPGLNGLYSVFVGLFYWGIAVQEGTPEYDRWASALDDVHFACANILKSSLR